MHEERMEQIFGDIERNGPIGLLFDAAAVRLREAANAHLIDTQQAHIQLDRDVDSGERTVTFGLAENFELWVKNQGEILEITVPVPEEDLEIDGETLARLLSPMNPDRHFTIVWRKEGMEETLFVRPNKVENYPAWSESLTPGIQGTPSERCWDLIGRIQLYDGVPIRKRRLS